MCKYAVINLKVRVLTLKCLRYFSLPFVHNGGPSGPP